MLEGCVSDIASIISIDSNTPAPEAISQAVIALQAGSVIIAPTETRYGMLTRGDSEAALTRLFAIKRRPTGLPTAVFLPSAYLIPHYAELSPIAKRLAEKFLPGPMTLILNARSDNTLPIVREGKIGIRVSSSPVIKAIIEQVDFPVTATSANLSGEAELDTIAEIAALFQAEVGLYLDAGIVNQPVSTVVDCTKDTIEIVRPGELAEQIRKEAGTE